MALITTQEVMDAMAIRSATETDRIDLLREYAESIIKSYVKWGIEEDEVTEYYSGSGTPTLALRGPYVSEVESVKIDAEGAWGQKSGSFAAAALTAGVDYALLMNSSGNTTSSSGMLVRLANPTYLSPGWPSAWSYYTGGVTWRQLPSWEWGNGNIKVVYTYGFPTIPDDIKAAVVQTVALLTEQSKVGMPVTSESLGAHSYSAQLGSDPAFADVRKILSRYRLLSL